MATLAGVTALAVLVTACGSEAKPTAAPRAALTATPFPTLRAPDGGGIRLVEEGLSAMWDPDEKELATYGIVVENTSRDWVAVKTKARIRLNDSSGKAIKDLGNNATDVFREIGVVFPGQRVGVGANIHVDRPGAVTILVEIEESTWVPPENDVLPVARVTASQVRTQRVGGGPAATLTFTVDSEYPDSLDTASTQAIFRDSGGRILGGTGPDRGAAPARYPHGQSTGRIDARYGPPAGTDPGQTEVYILPFCC